LRFVGREDERMEALVLRLEGVVLPEAFVEDTLYAYAGDHLGRWLGEHWLEPGVRARAVSGGATAGSDSWEQAQEGVLAVLGPMMREPGLAVPAESLRESVWCDGCERGHVRAEMYDDVLRGLARWRAAGLVVTVFSTVAAEAQRTLFVHAEEGDLSPLVAAWFDTRAGMPTESAAYVSMAQALGVAVERVLYLTTGAREADAAVAAGMQALVVERLGAVREAGHSHRVETDLEML